MTQAKISAVERKKLDPSNCPNQPFAVFRRRQKMSLKRAMNLYRVNQRMITNPEEACLDMS